MDQGLLESLDLAEKLARPGLTSSSFSLSVPWQLGVRHWVWAVRVTVSSLEV